MSWQMWAFVLCVALIGYAYLGYAAVVWMLARVSPRPVRHSTDAPKAASIVIAAYNEAGNIERRIREFLELLAPFDGDSELLVVSDGSTDGTALAARRVNHRQLRVIELPRNMGKAVALNTGVAAACNDIVVFADARQRWAPDAISRMLQSFADQAVGAVSGNMVLEKSDGTLAGVGLYWKLEKLIRHSESRWRSTVQVTGAISAVRKALYEPIPQGTILDDVYWPLGVAMRGYRVIHEPRAYAYDRLPERSRDEFRRKVRTLSGNLQLVMLRPTILLPWRSPSWFALVNHKLLRLVVPWAMLGALLASAASSEAVLRGAFVAQVVVYGCGVVAMCWRRAAQNRVANTISSLLVLNAAAAMAWFVYAAGRSGTSWKKVAYRTGGHGLTAGAKSFQGVG